MSTDDKRAGYDRTQDPHQRNDALEFFGLPKEPLPEVALAADEQAARVPDPVQQAHADGTDFLPSSGSDPVAFFGFSSHHPLWTNVRM